MSKTGYYIGGHTTGHKSLERSYSRRRKQVDRRQTLEEAIDTPLSLTPTSTKWKSNFELGPRQDPNLRQQQAKYRNKNNKRLRRIRGSK